MVKIVLPISSSYARSISENMYARRLYLKVNIMVLSGRRLLISCLLILAACTHTDNNDGIKKAEREDDIRFNRNISKAYADCSVIYGIASGLMAKTQPKNEALYADYQSYLAEVAKQIVAETEDYVIANELYLANAKEAATRYQKMVEDRSGLAPDFFKKKIRECKMAVSDPKGFVLSVMDSNKISNNMLPKPINIDTEKLTSAMTSGAVNSKSATADVSLCKPPRLKLTMDRSYLTMRGNYICTSKDSVDCDAKNSWQSIPEYYKTQLPDHKLLSHGHGSKVENGKLKNFITVCLESRLSGEVR